MRYFAGFFPANNVSNPNQMSFGVYRTHVQVDQFLTGTVTEPFIMDNKTDLANNIDVATVYHDASYIPYDSEFKPIMLHLRNVSGAPINTTFLIVVEPYFGIVTIVEGNLDHSLPLAVSRVPYRTSGCISCRRVVSAVAWGSFVFVGVSVPGNGTAWIDKINILTPVTDVVARIDLPAGYSNPQAMVLDFFSHPTPTLYVGCNGGQAVIRIDVTTNAITGYQALPFYLHRVWVGTSAPEHIYFATNEQHAKVFRVAKSDFCPATCPMFGFCKNGKCQCDKDFDLKRVDGKEVCEWHTLVIERKKEVRNHAGEVTLGIFFMLAVIAAVAGWYLVWRNKRSAYQAV